MDEVNKIVKSIPDWRWWLYGNFCHDLLDIIQGLRNEIAGQNGLISKLQLDINIEKAKVQEWKERATTENKDGAIAVQVIRERMRGGETKCILNAHERGSKMRIIELEKEVIRLKNIISNTRSKESW